VPKDFDPEVYLSTGWRIMSGDGMMEVVLRFNSAVTPHVKERKWHASQKLEMMEDGGCLLRVEIAEPLEMQPWIRSWGSMVEVLAPGWLREQIAEELRRAVEQYK
jgi:predicted DNA-binding transcriptional regulator YafY